ncbi:ABC transporter ATP-binding protein [Alteribacillus iranensis]|uniref:Carbohydrate ABC transporter ATP-binding protein, CUT1 family n=1 Tax=Alteribacillus iranensis TaxID=930128 RepID=A0A1I2BJ63_9BACI|nr:sn-glycerol-3-phosphate ABC transporter ATP-binding protein UgpC [Alteribacillus iranensis]SFE56079.1 carbohydrate ABC transporter ATP-binding protein, CUT1 family [Alteribacillus iranensis]
MADISLQHIYKTYDQSVTAVNDFDLNIHDKEFIVLVGPSGCGKSTTLRMIAGLEDITEGNLIIGDKLMNDVPSKKRNIAMVFQNYALYPHMNVYNNIAFGLKLRKMKKDEIEKKVKRAAHILGIESLLDRKPKELSGGQRQRVALGRAIVREADVFLMDEPLSNLDAKLRVQMRAEISKLHKQLQTTMIYVTHDQIEAMTMADRLVIMKDGVIQQVGTPKEVYNSPKNVFVGGFIGSPPMNFIRGQLAQDTFYFGDQAVVLPNTVRDRLADYQGKEVIMGIRPENMEIEDSSDETPGQAVEVYVEVCELMGAESYLHCHVAENRFIAKVYTQDEVAEGEQLQLRFDMKNVHFFDTQTEECLTLNHTAKEAGKPRKLATV